MVEPEFMELSDVENSWIEQIKSPKHIIVRLFWVLSYLSMIGVCVYICALLLIDYMTYSSYDLVSVTHGSRYVLPAITVCNVNKLNKTQMSLEKYKGKTVYDLHMNLKKSFADRGSTSKFDYEGIDDLDINRNFALDIEKTVIKELLTFAKESISEEVQKTAIKTEYTEMGKCLEINDNAKFVQRIDGSTGGLTIVLDTMTQHYVDDTVSEGFYVIIRMPNETVLHKEFSFLVSAGQQVFVKLDTVDRTRLETPYGECANKTDIYNQDAAQENDVISLKECFLNQQLWSYLSEYQCRCYPWFFYQRFLKNTKSGKYYKGLDDILIKYFTSEIASGMQIKFNETCVYKEDGFLEGGLLDNKPTSSIEECDTMCRDTDDCVVYMYSSETNDIQEGNQCRVYSKNTKLVYPDSGTTISGLSRGEVNCTGGRIKECPVSLSEKCENIVIGNMMDKAKHPPACQEPCSYQEYKYELSFSEYPAVNYWNNILKPIVGRYDTHFDSKLNLVKLVFFTEQMKSISAVQTAAYEIQNFIANIGGLTDFFMGLSFFTVFQLLEWFLTQFVKRSNCRKSQTSPSVNCGTCTPIPGKGIFIQDS